MLANTKEIASADPTCWSRQPLDPAKDSLRRTSSSFFGQRANTEICLVMIKLAGCRSRAVGWPSTRREVSPPRRTWLPTWSNAVDAGGCTAANPEFDEFQVRRSAAGCSTVQSLTTSDEGENPTARECAPSNSSRSLLIGTILANDQAAARNLASCISQWHSIPQRAR
jgi:hypothetical protein